MISSPRQEPERVVITGMGVLCAIGNDVDSFGAALREGRSGIEFTGDGGENEPKLAAEVRDFNFSEALGSRKTLPEQLRQNAWRAAFRSPFPTQVAVMVALEAWENASLHLAPIRSNRLSLIVAGHNFNGLYLQNLYAKFRNGVVHAPPRLALQLQDTDHIGTLSEILSITGEGYTVGGASASGNVGIINGSRLVELGVVDACLVVGALTDLSVLEKQAYFNLGVMAGKSSIDDPKAVCRPFDQASEGFVYGQGSACLILEAERSAKKRGAKILAELAGYDLKLDGSSLAVPREEGEASVMVNAIRRAAIEPKDISYVNAHGTASPLGDETEVRALRRALGQFFSGPWINATKALTGHCLCAAGVIEAAATVLQMREDFVHPNVNLTCPIAIDGRFVGTRAEATKIDFALSNSFGFGGINTSILLAHPSS